MEINTTPKEAQILQKEKFPLGMIIILVIVGFGLAGTLFGLIKPMAQAQLGPLVLVGLSSRLYSLLVAGMLGAIFYGILKREIWARKLTIVWYLLSMGIVVLNYISFLADKQSIIRFYKEVSPANAALFTDQVLTATLTSSLVMGIIMSFVIIFYVYRKRDFFNK